MGIQGLVIIFTCAFSCFHKLPVAKVILSFVMRKCKRNFNFQQNLADKTILFCTMLSEYQYQCFSSQLLVNVRAINDRMVSDGVLHFQRVLKPHSLRQQQKLKEKCIGKLLRYLNISWVFFTKLQLILP